MIMKMASSRAPVLNLLDLESEKMNAVDPARPSDIVSACSKKAACAGMGWIAGITSDFTSPANPARWFKFSTTKMPAARALPTISVMLFHVQVLTLHPNLTDYTL